MKIANGQRWLWEGKTGRKYIAEVIRNSVFGTYNYRKNKYEKSQDGKVIQVISGSKPSTNYAGEISLKLTGSSPMNTGSGTWTYLEGQDKPKPERKSAPKKKAVRRRRRSW